MDASGQGTGIAPHRLAETEAARGPGAGRGAGRALERRRRGRRPGLVGHGLVGACSGKWTL